MHWTDNFITRTYDTDAYNCGHLIVDIQKEVFGRNVDYVVPKESEDTDYIVETINKQKDKVIQVDTPEEGDLVVLNVKGQPTHIGVVWYHGKRPYVMHGMNRKRSVINTELAVLERFGMTVEGFYRPLENNNNHGTAGPLASRTT